MTDPEPAADADRERAADAGEERPPAGAPVVHMRPRTAFGSLTVRRG